MDAAPHHRQMGYVGPGHKKEEGRQLICSLSNRRKHLHKGKKTSETHQFSKHHLRASCKYTNQRNHKQQLQGKHKCKQKQLRHSQRRDAQEIAQEPRLHQGRRYRDRSKNNRNLPSRHRRWGRHHPHQQWPQSQRYGSTTQPR